MMDVIYKKSLYSTEKLPDASEDIFTAYIDVIEPKHPWYSRIIVHGNGAEDAEKLRDKIISALNLQDALKALVSNTDG